MKYTLRAARKLETKINQYVKGFDESVIDSLSIYEDDPRSLHTEKRERFLSNIGNYLKAIDLRFKIRRDIQIVNEENGINDRTAERKRLQDLAYFLETAINPSYVERRLADAPSLWNKLEALKDSGPTVNEYSTVESVAIPVLTQTDIDVYNAAVVEYNREIELIDEQLLALNSSTKIEINDDDIAFLKQIKVI